MRNVRNIILVAMISMILFEVTLRILVVFPADSKLYLSDPDVGYRVRPNFAFRQNAMTNSRGFNDIERAHQSTHAHRVAIVGDSFVFGAVARKHNFVSILQNLANAETADVEVLNMGIPGAGPRNYLGLIRHDAYQFEVDVIVVMIFVGNDIIQSHPDFETIAWFGTPRSVLRSPYLVGPSQEYFYAFRAGRTAVRFLRRHWHETNEAQLVPANLAAIEYQCAAVFSKAPSAMISESYQGTVEIIRALARETNKLEKNLIIVLAPDQLQVDPSIRSELVQRYAMDFTDYDLTRPQAIITRVLFGSGVTIVDLLRAFQDETTKHKLYIQGDTHWNDAGNRLAAEMLWPQLRHILGLNSSLAGDVINFKPN